MGIFCQILKLYLYDISKLQSISKLNVSVQGKVVYKRVCDIFTTYVSFKLSKKTLVIFNMKKCASTHSNNLFGNADLS